MKALPICLVTSIFLLVSVPHVHGEMPPTSIPQAQQEFLEPGKWWNLTFVSENNPLKRGDFSIHAVKILKLSETHSSWVQIAFPRDDEEHTSIFGPTAKAHEDSSLDLQAELAEWEKTITDWEVIWVNLHYVVKISPVGK